MSLWSSLLRSSLLFFLPCNAASLTRGACAFHRRHPPLQGDPVVVALKTLQVASGTLSRADPGMVATLCRRLTDICSINLAEILLHGEVCIEICPVAFTLTAATLTRSGLAVASERQMDNPTCATSRNPSPAPLTLPPRRTYAHTLLFFLYICAFLLQGTSVAQARHAADVAAAVVSLFRGTACDWSSGLQGVLAGLQSAWDAALSGLTVPSRLALRGVPAPKAAADLRERSPEAARPPMRTVALLALFGIRLWSSIEPPPGSLPPIRVSSLAHAIAAACSLEEAGLDHATWLAVGEAVHDLLVDLEDSAALTLAAWLRDEALAGRGWAAATLQHILSTLVEGGHITAASLEDLLRPLALAPRSADWLATVQVVFARTRSLTATSRV